jgi:hypothetical protein
MSGRRERRGYGPKAAIGGAPKGSTTWACCSHSFYLNCSDCAPAAAPGERKVGRTWGELEERQAEVTNRRERANAPRRAATTGEEAGTEEADQELPTPRRLGAAGHERQHRRAEASVRQRQMVRRCALVLVVSAKQDGKRGRVERDLTLLRAVGELTSLVGVRLAGVLT